MPLRAVFLDWDGTLSHSKFWETRVTNQFDADTVNRFTTFLFQHSPELVQRWMKGHATSTDVTRLLADRFGLDADALHTDLRHSCEQMCVADNTVLDRVERLRRLGLHVAIATDNMDTFTNWTVPALGLRRRFDGILNSHLLGAFKKEITDGQSLFFDGYLAQHGIHPAEAILIDDSPHNAVVETFGMRFTQVTPQHPLAVALDAVLAELQPA